LTGIHAGVGPVASDCRPAYTVLGRERGVVPKLPRVNAREKLRVLRSDGWEVEAPVGSHLQLRQAAKSGKVTVPVHSGDAIGPRLLKSILDQAGLSADDFRRLR